MNRQPTPGLDLSTDVAGLARAEENTTVATTGMTLAAGPPPPALLATAPSPVRATTLLAAPNLSSLSSLIFTVLGTIIMAVVAVRIFTAYAKKSWGELITEVVAVIFVGWFVWFPDSAKATLTAIIQGIFG